MTTVLKDLFTSKKFLAALSAVIIYLAGRFGFDLDPAALDRIFAALLVYVGAQGAADIGKSAAAINAVASDRSLSTESSLAMERVAKTVPMLAVLLLGAGLVTSQVSCSGTAGQRAATGIGAALDCGSPALKEAALAAGNLAQAAILSTVSGSGHVDAASFKAALTGIKDAGLMCAVAGVVAALATPAPKSSVMASGLEVDSAELQRVFAMAKAELGWPAMKAAGG